MASICAGSQAKSKKVPPKQVSRSSKELKVSLSISQETNGKDTGCWCG